MDIGAVFLSLALLVLVGMFISVPFLQKARREVESGEDLSGLLAEHERILNALQELDFDNTLGKIPAEDYPDMRRALMQSGVAILKQLDEMQQTGTSASAEEQLEAAIAARRVDSARVAVGDPATLDEDLEVLIARRRTTRKERSAGFCPKCGNPILVTDVFCPKCGNSLK